MVKTAGLFLINNKRELLIAHPTNHPIDFWSIPKGIVDESDVNFINAAIRETIEETNVDVSNYDYIHELTPIKYKNGKKTLHPYVLFEWENNRIDFSGFEFKCNSIVESFGFYEMDDFKWSSFDELPSILHKPQQVVLDEIKKLYLNNI